MKRDMDLIRDILFWMEQRPRSANLCPENSPKFASRDFDDVQETCYQMWQHGLIRGADASADDGDSVIPLGIAPLGHDFIEGARRAGAWDRAKAAINSPLGAASIPVFIQALLAG